MASSIRGTLSRACKRTVSYAEPMDIPIERRTSEKYDTKMFYDVEIKERDIMLVIVTNSMSGYLMVVNAQLQK